MSNVVIPFSNYANFTESVVLDNVKYTFDFVWNTRGEFWSMSISDANGVVLISGIRVVLFYDLLQQYKYIRELPQGTLIAIDKSATTCLDEPRLKDFVQDRFLELCYVEAAA